MKVLGVRRVRRDGRSVLGAVQAGTDRRNNAPPPAGNGPGGLAGGACCHAPLPGTWRQRSECSTAADSRVKDLLFCLLSLLAYRDAYRGANVVHTAIVVYLVGFRAAFLA